MFGNDIETQANTMLQLKTPEQQVLLIRKVTREYANLLDLLVQKGRQSYDKIVAQDIAGRDQRMRAMLTALYTLNNEADLRLSFPAIMNEIEANQGRLASAVAVISQWTPVEQAVDPLYMRTGAIGTLGAPIPGQSNMVRNVMIIGGIAVVAYFAWKRFS